MFQGESTAFARARRRDLTGMKVGATVASLDYLSVGTTNRLTFKVYWDLQNMLGPRAGSWFASSRLRCILRLVVFFRAPEHKWLSALSPTTRRRALPRTVDLSSAPEDPTWHTAFISKNGRRFFDGQIQLSIRVKIWKLNPTLFDLWGDGKEWYLYKPMGNF